MTAQSILQSGTRSAYPAAGQLRQGVGIAFALRDCTQDLSSAHSEQIRQEAGELDLHFLQQRLDLALQTDALARQLMPRPRQTAPLALLRVGHKAQSQFAGRIAPQQPLGISEIT